MSIKQKNYLSTREAAELLNVAVSTIQLWTDNGMLHAWTTVGGHRRIEKKSVHQMLIQQNTPPNKNNSRQPLSIVVVEDNEQQQEIYKQNFELCQLNAKICIAKDGYAGLINIGQTLPDIIITDLMMPNMNGFELIKSIKENINLKNCIIIVVSALTSDEINERGGLPSDVVIFSKPLQFNEIEKIIRNKSELDVA